MDKKQYDHFLTSTNYAAIVMKQQLMPVEGMDNGTAIIYPPTFADVGYNIDKLQTGDNPRDKDDKSPPNVCLIDSVGSQANRMEPVFKEEAYKGLVPQISVHVKTKETDENVDLLDAGHRIADAIARFSELAPEIDEAFLAAKNRNAEPLARLSPTSLVFGCWDSRGSGVKLPRVIRSTIRATNVYPLTRSAQYVPAMNYTEAGVLTEDEAKKGSEQGFGHVPSTDDPGGVLLDENSAVLKEGVLSLSALRALAAEDDETTLALRRYILGLSLVAFTTSQESLLRMGCELTPNPDVPATWELVKSNGEREQFSLTHDEALEFAQAAAAEFGVAEERVAEFNPKKAKESLKAKKK